MKKIKITLSRLRFRLKGAWCALTYKNYAVVAYNKPDDVTIRYDIPLNYLKYLCSKLPDAVDEAKVDFEMDRTLREFKQMLK